ncbi:MAG: MFS transporter, partial [Deltaproteobacteria bacterium]
RAGHGRAIVLFLAITGGLILLIGLVHDPILSAVLIILQSSSAVCMFPAGFAMLSHGFPPSLRNLAVSLVIMISYLVGGGMFPLGMGYIAEKLSFSWSFGLLGIFTLAMVPVLLGISGKKQAQDSGK